MTGYDPADRLLGGFSELDGTMEFFSRLGALLEPHFVVVDLGAGRGSWHSEDRVPFRRNLRDIRSKVAEYVGVDVDPAVLTNPTTTRNALIVDGRLPMDDASADLILCDYVLEHIQDVGAFRDEVFRVLKPGGVFCGRTPHTLNYVSLAARVIKNAKHANWLRRVQPNRKAEDVFPTAYRCNTLGALDRVFAGWENFSYLYASEPQYYFGSKIAFHLFAVVHKLAPAPLTGNLFVFLRKPA